MKAFYLPLIILTGLVASCNKTHTTPSGNGGTNGGGSDTLSVTGFSPLYPYTTDEITITGTGFNPDKTKDSVIVSYPGNGAGKLAAIHNATATQLKIVVPADSVMSLFYLAFPTYVFDIFVNGKHLQLGLDKTPIFKPALQLFGFRGQQYDGSIRPGDTVLITGTGFTPSANTLSVGGQLLNLFKVDTALGEFLSNTARYDVESNCDAFSAIPKLFFGETNDETVKQSRTVTFTNGDGKSLQIQDSFYTSPIMKINSIFFETTFDTQNGYSYSLSSLNNTGGKIRLHIVGKNLKNNTDLEFTGYNPANTTVIDTHSTLGVSGFPDSTVVEYGTGGLQAGNTYTVRIWASNTGQKLYYGIGKFYMKP